MKTYTENGISIGSTEYINNEFKKFILTELKQIPVTHKKIFAEKDLVNILKINSFFFSEEYQNFAKCIFKKLDEFSIYLRYKLVHIASYCVRMYGTLNISSIESNENLTERLNDIYKIAEIINSIIKNRRKEIGRAHIIIDRLKNSYEMNYFREKYSGYHTISITRNETERRNSIRLKINSIYNDEVKVNDNYRLIESLDRTEYLISEFKEGKFEGFDIENCVQKADYHIWYNKNLSNISIYDKFEKDVDNNLKFEGKTLDKVNEYYVYQPLLIQVLKLTALIKQPGIITPSYTERIMQIAYNTKLNSGCISRQVGAVVTDKNFSVKGIGWNEVANGQLPCSSRDIRDFGNADENNKSGFTLFELGKSEHKYKDSKNFQEKLQDDINKVQNNLDEKLKGRPCTFCFKTHHNAYEAKENQVHTRSLHAEENAMLQISKFGGQPLQGGNLFTTASTCELCAKKAYQLGIKNIFYIDVYPGISKEQILNNGSNIPKVFAFQGAIGRGFNKLYEQFISHKDETFIRTQFKATINPKEQASQLQNIIGSKIIKDDEELKNHLNSLKDDPAIIEKIVELMKKGLTSKN